MPLERAVPFLLATLASVAAADPAAAPPPAPAADAAVATLAAPEPVPLGGGVHGVSLDDFSFVPELGAIVVPAGQTGALVLVDPKGGASRTIAGVTAADRDALGHDLGTTSVGYGAGLLFASDRGKHELVVVDPAKGKVLERAALAGGPDIVRFITGRDEVWVTEPEANQIEVFRFDAKRTPRLARLVTIAVDGGPEALAVDQKHGRVYTNLFADKTLAIDSATHAVVASWPNSCVGSRGLAFDAARDFLFVGCTEGKVVTLAVVADGTVLGHAAAGAGVDLISYSPTLHHLYAPGGKAGVLTVVAVAASGAMSVVAVAPSPIRGHCVADDGAGAVFVCDPHAGSLQRYTDH